MVMTPYQQLWSETLIISVILKPSSERWRPAPSRITAGRPDGASYRPAASFDLGLP